MEKKETEKKVVKKAVVKTQNYNHDEVANIAKEFAKSIGAETGIQHINRKEPYDCVTIIKGNRTVAWFLPRAGGLRYSIYLFGDGPRQVINVGSDDAQAKAFGSITEVYNKVKDKPPKQKKSKNNLAKAKRTLDKVLRQLDRLKAGKAMKVPTGYTSNDEAFVKAIEEHSGRFDWDNQLIYREGA